MKLGRSVVRDQPVLETERLRLRVFEPGDAGRVHQLAGDERIAEMTAQIPHPYPDGLANEWIAEHGVEWGNGTGIIYAIVLKEEEAVIGAVSITHIRAGEGELGYWVGVPYWGRGYCTEAVRALICFSVESCGIERIYARHLARNPASGRVLCKAGLAHYGREVITCGYRPGPA